MLRKFLNVQEANGEVHGPPCHCVAGPEKDSEEPGIGEGLRVMFGSLSRGSSFRPRVVLSVHLAII